MSSSDDIGKRWSSDFSVVPKEVEAEFDEEAARYDDDLRDWDYRVPEDGSAILSKFVRHTENILDAGCGTGLVGSVLRRLGYHDICGCDLSQAMLHLAETKNVYTELKRADLCQRLPYEANVFDALTCLGTLSFIEDAEFTFREFCRITRRGGIVLFSYRCDLFESRQCEALCLKLEHGGLWTRRLQSDPFPYLPRHSEYTDKLLVAYFVFRVEQQ